LKKENKIEIENNKRLCVNIQSCSDDIHRFAVKHKLKGTDKEACPLMLIMNLLDDNGTAVGVLKEGLFFDSAYSDLRKVLLQEFNVKEIISVPSNQFENTSTKTSIIIFTKEQQKTSQINFSELKVNLYDKDEFIEKDNKIYLKYNKGDIINVEEIFIKSVSIDEIISNENISLNHKDYNKIAIECGEDFKLVKIKDICEFLPKSKRNASFGKDTGLYNFHSSSYNIKKCDEADYEEECIIIGTGGVANIKIDKNFSCSADNILIKSNSNSYIYYLLLGNIKLLSDGFNGSTIKHLSKDYLKELEIPIPKSEELIEYWVNKISTPYNLKQEKEKRLKEVENEIQMKIKDIQENQKCDEVKFADIFNIKTGKLNSKDIIKNGKYPYYNSSINNPIGKTNKVSFTGKKYIIMIRCGGNSKNKISNNHALGQVYLIDKDIGANEGLYQLNIININYNIYYLYYFLKLKTPYLQETANYTTGIGNLHKEKLRNMLIKIPKDKSLIDSLQPLFNEVEELQKEIRELDEIYNNYLQELSKSAIKNQEILNGTIKNEIIDEDDEKTETNSDNSLNLDELKEQCKSLGIKGYSKKTKDELIEIIKNHK
jgi:type I restriction enzyme S subunit